MTEERIYQLVVMVLAGACSLALVYAARYIDHKIKTIDDKVDQLKADIARRIDDAGARTSKKMTEAQGKFGDLELRYRDLNDRVTRLEEHRKFADAWRERKQPRA